MIQIEERMDALVQLGEYLGTSTLAWEDSIDRAAQANAWFNREHILLATNNIRKYFLDRSKLNTWLSSYHLPDRPRKVGIVMAGNIPLVGFHDFLCGFLSGHHLLLKLSSKDGILLHHLLDKLTEWNPDVAEQVQIADRLNGCDAYIATGNNNTARYFEQYFGQYPHIIRRNRTSVAVLDGTESTAELEALADDVFQYYGLGCRNVTQVCVPEGYYFEPFLIAMSKYSRITNFHKYNNNYDYHLAIYLLNRVPYLTNGSLLMVQSDMPFSAVSVLHYRYYMDKQAIITELEQSTDIQAIAGHDFHPFGSLQQPSLTDFADGVDTMAFLCGL